MSPIIGHLIFIVVVLGLVVMPSILAYFVLKAIVNAVKKIIKK